MDKSYTHIGSHDNLLGKDASAELETEFSNEKQVTKETPCAFIAYSDDDKTVPPANGVNYYLGAAQESCTSRTPYLCQWRTWLGYPRKLHLQE